MEPINKKEIINFRINSNIISLILMGIPFMYYIYNFETNIILVNLFSIGIIINIYNIMKDMILTKKNNKKVIN